MYRFLVRRVENHVQNEQKCMSFMLFLSKTIHQCWAFFKKILLVSKSVQYCGLSITSSDLGVWKSYLESQLSTEHILTHSYTWAFLVYCQTKFNEKHSVNSDWNCIHYNCEITLDKYNWHWNIERDWIVQRCHDCKIDGVYFRPINKMDVCAVCRDYRTPNWSTFRICLPLHFLRVHCTQNIKVRVSCPADLRKCEGFWIGERCK